MKLIKILASVICCVIAVHTQAEQATITLKSGAKVTGELISMDPTCCVEFKIAGQQTTININDIDMIETASSKSTTVVSPNLPKEKIVNIAGVDVKFILVEGGTFTYGYDGSGSVNQQSEPIHDITLSSFYCSEYPVKADLYNAVGFEPAWDGITIHSNHGKRHIIAPMHLVIPAN